MRELARSQIERLNELLAGMQETATDDDTSTIGVPAPLALAP